MRYDDYAGLENMPRFSQVATDFDFDDPRLGRVSFPADFVAAYQADALRWLEDGDALADAERLWFVLPWPGDAQAAMLQGLLSVDQIYSVNRILADSLYAGDGAIILPPGLYAIGTAFDRDGEVEVMVNLAPGSPRPGSIHAWRKAHDPLGTGDNATAPVFLADDLGTFLTGLTTEAEARASLAAKGQ